FTASFVSYLILLSNSSSLLYSCNFLIRLTVKVSYSLKISTSRSGIMLSSRVSKIVNHYRNGESHPQLANSFDITKST
ncbi:MAG: hypothetical protein WBP64_20295, partial [Nitrososphaeraceae archaeon]